MDLSITLATETDIPAILQILSSAVEYKLARGDHSWDTKPFSEDEVRDMLTDNETYAIRLSGEVVGTITLNWEDESRWLELHAPAGYIHRLAIKEGFHGRGLGELAVDWAIERTRSQGLDLVRLDCTSSNQKLCSYYQKQGFKLVKSVYMERFKVEVALLERQI